MASRVKLKLIKASSLVKAPPGATERIVESITSAIVERRLMPGTKLVEQKIAGIFKVSRTIVRQALNQLCRDRLVTLEPARGAHVAMPGIEEARQVFELRNMIEGALVSELCARITDGQLALLQAHLKAEAQAGAKGQVSERTRLLSDFHVVLAQLMGNAVLAEIMKDLLSRSQLISLMYQSAHSAEESHREHEQVVVAIGRRDARAAARLMKHHIDSVERNLRTNPGATDLDQILHTKA